MTPAINTAKRAGINFELHEYQSRSDGAGRTGHSWGAEAAEILGLDAARVFKTLIARIDGKQLAVGIVPVAGELNLKALAAAAGGKKAEMAAADAAQRSSGYVLGGISPLGQKQSLPTFLDELAELYPTIFVSAGRRGLEIELAARDLLQLTNGKLAQIARP